MSSLTFIIFVLLNLNLYSLSSAKRCHPDDQRALLRIKDHFNNATFFSTWTPHTACCKKWSGVSCKRLHNSWRYRVNVLDISDDEGIIGEIPSAVGDLPYLETLMFKLLPNLTGPIPSAIGKLIHLKFLVLLWNNLTGPIPTTLRHLTSVSSISLNNNRLTGPIPSIFHRLPELRELDLSQNELTGTIPASFGCLQDEFSLRLSNNKLYGPIPKSLGQVNFMILLLAGNRLIGDASFLFGAKKTNYGTLNLSRNRLAFDLNKTELPILMNILELDLSHNMIYGRLPLWISQEPGLSRFNASYNRLCGPIPAGSLQRFDASSFAHNECLCGPPLPPCNPLPA